MFRLLEKAEEGDADADAGRGLIRDARMLGSCSLYRSLLAPFFMIRGGTLMVICCLASAVPENPAISIVQQQQAEQMRVYWKVSISFLFCWGLSCRCVAPWCNHLFFFFFDSSMVWSPKTHNNNQQFIEGMLTNLGTLPLDRIQTMLKFAPGYDRSIDQLALFMEAARREGLVVVRDGVWRLNK